MYKLLRRRKVRKYITIHPSSILNDLATALEEGLRQRRRRTHSQSHGESNKMPKTTSLRMSSLASHVMPSWDA
jgi:hypothetical protein